MTRAIKDGHVIAKPAKESTAQWKPSVASLRGTKGLGKAAVNPLEAPKGELGRAVKTPNPK